MSSDRFHKAAKDGLLDVLKEATKREVNARDVDQMTPVLWAAFEGRLDALRLLVGRGGDPDKADQFGNTALHFAAARGHMQCVDFLIKFGVNIYALDIDRHSAKDLAYINNRDNILRYLDTATANLEATDRKKSKILKETAEKNYEKRTKDYMKRQQKIDQDGDDTKVMPHRTSTVLASLTQKLWTGSQGNLKHTQQREMTSNTTTFSSLVGGTISGARSGSAVQRKAQAIKAKQQADGDFKVGEMESTGKRSLRSLQGLRRDSEVLYVGTFNSAGGLTGKRGKIADVFEVETLSNDEEGDDEEVTNSYGTLSRSFSQPDFASAIANDDNLNEEVVMQRPSGLFNRPSLGSLAFRRSVTATLSQLAPDVSSVDSSCTTATKRKPQRIKPRNILVMSDSDTDVASSSDTDQEDGLTPLERFLLAFGLKEYYHIFQQQKIDLDTLMILTETDLKSLDLPLGPFRKLVNAIQERNNALNNPGAITDSRL